MSTTADSSRKSALSFIFVTVLIDMLAFSVVIPVLPVLVQKFMGGDTARAAQMVGIFSTAWAGPSCSLSSRPCRDLCPIVSGVAP